MINFLIHILIYINTINNLTYNFNIFIHKFNLYSKKLLYYFKINSNNNTFNFRNKFNFNKSKHNILNIKKTGKARVGSASAHILSKWILWYGLRFLPLKYNKLNKFLLKYFIINKKNIISIYNLEIIKLIYNIIFYDINLHNKFFNYNNIMFINSIKKYIYLTKKKGYITLIN